MAVIERGLDLWAPVAAPTPGDVGARTVRAKRVVDVAAAGAAVVVLAPLLVVLALAVRLSSPGPVLFRQRRVGRRGVPFEVVKFRTMRVDAERDLRSAPRLYWDYVTGGYKLPPGRDPRVTGVGRWLRRFDLDELPQLWNVLRGEMSLVGPRPVPEVELGHYGALRPYYEAVRPGMTGLWQVSGRNRLPYDQRVALDLDYVQRLSVGRDLSILARTLPAMVRGGGTPPEAECRPSPPAAWTRRVEAVAWGAAMFTAPLNGLRVGRWLTLCEVSLAVAMAATAVSGWGRRHEVDAVDRVALAGLALLAAGVLWGTSLGLDPTVGAMPAARFLLTTTAVATLLLWRPPRAQLRMLCLLWVAGALFSAVWALLVSPTVAGRRLGLASHPNSLGLVCVLGIGVAVAFLFTSRRFAFTLVAAGSCLALFGATFASGSRAALLGVVSAVPMVALLSARRRVAGVTAALAVVVTGAVFIGVVHDPVLEDIGRQLGDRSTVESDTQRLRQFDRSLDRIRERPLSGQGLQFAQEAHSVYVQVLVVAGPLGLIGLMVVSGSLLVGARRGISRHGGAVTGDHTLLAGLAGGYVGYLVAAAFQNSLTTHYVWLYLACTLALAADVRGDCDRGRMQEMARSGQPSTSEARQGETAK